MNIRTTVLMAGAMGMASIAAAQDQIDVPVDGGDRYYYTASVVFGEDQVQMHYLHLEGSYGADTVSDFNCKDRTIQTVFESRSAPEVFPLEHNVGTAEAIEPGSAEEYLAKAACSRNGLTFANGDG